MADFPDRFKIRRDTAANWTSNNPTLLEGELGWESDTKKLKIGDGATAWGSLGYSFDISAVVDGAPADLNTLNELAAAINDNGTFHETVLFKANNLSELTDVSAARTNLGVAIGTDVQAYDANLTSFVNTFTLPATDGDNGGYLTTNGAASLLFDYIGVGGGSFTATASGSIADGDPLIINADGTVSSAGFAGEADLSTMSALAVEQSVTPVEFSGNQPVLVSYDPTNDVWIRLRRSRSASLTYVTFGTRSGGVITWGVEDTSTHVAYATEQVGSVHSLGGGKWLFVYKSASDTNLQSVVIDYNGGAWTKTAEHPLGFGVNARNLGFSRASDGTFVFFYHKAGGMHAIAVSVSGTTISSGASLNTGFNVASTWNAFNGSVAYDGMYFYPMCKDGTDLKYCSLTLAGTTLSISQAPVTTGISDVHAENMVASIYDATAGKIGVFYRNSSGYPTAAVATPSGGTLSFGTPTVVRSNNTLSRRGNYSPITCDGNNNFLFFYGAFDSPTLVLHTMPASISGTSFSLGTEITYGSIVINGNSGFTSYSSYALYDTTPAATVVHYYGEDSAEAYRVYAGVQSTNLTASNFVGISAGAYVDTGTATVQTAGSVDDAQTGLTPGQRYYVQTDGSLGTTPDSPSVVAGVAVASTKLIVVN